MNGAVWCKVYGRAIVLDCKIVYSRFKDYFLHPHWVLESFVQVFVQNHYVTSLSEHLSDTK